MSKSLKVMVSCVALVVGGCTTVPVGPNVMVLPGTGKNFDQFRYDDSVCRQYAQGQIGGADANQAATDAGVKSAVVGTLVGAAIGAAADGSRGAGSGAAVGLAMGSMAGAGAAQSTGYATQRHYDVAYTQCMYAKGHRVPVSGQLQSAPSAGSYAPLPAAGGYYPPPPPSGYAPPPPR
ncbi:MAG: hypothetical protein PHU46_02410 [Rhodocyclaceae bacterium]|nr:hypothetical protein [Rhodocyclaceae bacterium]